MLDDIIEFVLEVVLEGIEAIFSRPEKKKKSKRRRNKWQ